MKKIKEILIKLNNWKFIILIMLIISGAFYWYEIRPSVIKKSCYNTAKGKAMINSNLPNNKFTKDDYDTYYKWCLESKGL